MAALARRPAPARTAFDEVLRWETPVQTFFRTTSRAVEIGGVTIGADEKVLLFLGAANRDPRKWEAPDQLDIGRNTAGHVALGQGIHVCVGQMIARLEAEMTVRRPSPSALRRFEIDGEARAPPEQHAARLRDAADQDSPLGRAS